MHCWSWIFCIICTAYLHTGVTLLKQGLAICPINSQMTAIGSNMLKEACTRNQHGWENGSLMPEYMQILTIKLHFNFWHNNINPVNSHSDNTQLGNYSF